MGENCTVQGNVNVNDKPKRKLTDYAGIAALLTAVGTLAFGMLDRVNHGESAERMQRSLYNANTMLIGQLIYRVEQLEKRLEVVRADKPEPSHRHGRRPASLTHPDVLFGSGSTAAATAMHSDEDEAAGESASDEAAEPAVAKAPAMPSFEMIQQTVDAGKVWSPPPNEAAPAAPAEE